MPGPSQYQAADDPRHDLTPWVETPNSTRVSSYRYDHATGELQVRWRNRPPSEGYVYQGSYEIYRGFARAVSKGKMINRVLDGLPYEPMTPDQINAPSNPQRGGVQSRVR
jgi:hypothetical protein